MRGSSETVNDCTSAVFEGMITLNSAVGMDGLPRGSWVAKWQRLEDYQPGLYAVKVSGVVSSVTDRNGASWNIRY